MFYALNFYCPCEEQEFQLLVEEDASKVKPKFKALEDKIQELNKGYEEGTLEDDFVVLLYRYVKENFNLMHFEEVDFEY